MLEGLNYVFIFLAFVCTFVGWRTDESAFHGLAVLFWTCAAMGSPNIELVGYIDTTGEAVITQFVGGAPYFFIFLALAVLDLKRILHLDMKATDD